MKGMSEYDVYFASCTKGILQIVAYSVYIDSCMKVCVLVRIGIMQIACTELQKMHEVE